MRNIPANLGGFKLMVTESPVMKMKENKDGSTEPVKDDDGVVKFLVSVFAKRRPVNGEPVGKGEEIKVTLASDPGEGFDDGVYVELIDSTVSPYNFLNEKGQTVAGISFAAAGMKPLS